MGSYQSSSEASAADMEKLSALQEQKGELRKRLSYTTHRLERLESEFDSTRHYLEIELRRAQEELEKVTEKLRRIQSNYMALQRINQELEDKLYRMGQHYEEEKRALSHEIVALNSHLLEAKVTIDKLSEDNELYRKDCSLAAQLLQCGQNYGRGHAVEMSPDFQGRRMHLEPRGCSLPPALCPAYADSGHGPASLSSVLSDGSMARGFRGELCCSDTALYCPDGRRPSPDLDARSSEAGFARASSESAADDDDGPGAFRRAAYASAAGSLPTSSSYSSFSATSEEREQALAATLTASQRALGRAYAPSLTRAASAGPRGVGGRPRMTGGSPMATLLPPEPWVPPVGPRWRPLSLDGVGDYTYPGMPVPPRSPYVPYRPDSASDDDGPSCFLGLSPGRAAEAAGSPEHPVRDCSPPRRGPRTGSAGLSRKDSLTRAQLYGTLLN